MKAAFLSMVGVGTLAFVSCTPVGWDAPGGQAGAQVQNAPLPRMNFPPAGSNHQPAPTVDQQRQLRERREELRNGGVAQSPPQASSRQPQGSQNPPATNTVATKPAPPAEVGYRYGMPVPGRKGWVYNPYTMNSVDIRGVASGRLIYDPEDPANRNPDGTLMDPSEMPHKFRVP